MKIKRCNMNKPNVIIIMTDDQGYGDLSCMGAEDFVTPNIDALAENGIRFTSMYSGSPVCSPSRACLLTGRYPELFSQDTEKPLVLPQKFPPSQLHLKNSAIKRVFQANGIWDSKKNADPELTALTSFPVFLQAVWTTILIFSIGVWQTETQIPLTTFGKITRKYMITANT